MPDLAKFQLDENLSWILHGAMMAARIMPYLPAHSLPISRGPILNGLRV
jgi:hypothetical protein